jgi:hypothetical protein
MIRYHNALYRAAIVLETYYSPIRLWRASGADFLLPPNAFAREREVAEVYLDNPGYGGEFLYTTMVKPQNVLDLYSEPRYAMRTLLSITGLNDPGAIGVDEWVMHQYVADALVDAGYDWVVVEESYPAFAETWVWLGGGEEPELEEIELEGGGPMIPRRAAFIRLAEDPAVDPFGD